MTNVVMIEIKAKMDTRLPNSSSDPDFSKISSGITRLTKEPSILKPLMVVAKKLLRITGFFFIKFHVFLK